MRFATASMLTAIILYTVAVFGLMHGAQVAYAADSPAEATVSFNGTHFTAGENVSKVNTSADVDDEPRGPVQEAINGSALDVESPADPYIRDAIAGFVESTVKGSFHLAAFTGGISAFVFYRLQFIPLWLVSGVFQVLGFVPYLGVGGIVFYRVREVMG